jgi:hypothetical protein
LRFLILAQEPGEIIDVLSDTLKRNDDEPLSARDKSKVSAQTPQRDDRFPAVGFISGRLEWSFLIRMTLSAARALD